jgi:hypothetical protein
MLDLFAAVEDGNAWSVQIALVGGALPDQFDPYGRTPLVYSIQLWDRGHGFKNVVQVLLAAGARVDLKSFDDWTPLMHAARLGHSEACEMLLAAGADPNAANFKGRTALMAAAYHLQESVLALLLQRGAAPTPADTQGRTAIDFLDARRKLLSWQTEDREKFRRCQKLLKTAGAKRRISTTLAPSGLHHFTEDELTQSRHPAVKSRKFLVIALSLSLLAVTLVHAGLGLQVAVGGALLLLYAFPSVLQLPYLLLTSPSERSVEVSTGSAVPVPYSILGLSDNQLRAEVGAGQLDAFSNFLRLSWGQQIQMIRARKPRLTHARSHLASIGLAVAIPLTIVVVAPLRTGSWAVDALLPGAVTLVALSLEGRLRNSRLKAFQANWDQVAAEINTKLTETMQQQPKQEEAFVLYLRTFGVTGLLTIGGIDFETSMAYNLAPMMPMIALGHPGEAIGAGRIFTTEEHWKEEILRLIENASLILLIPSHHEGTQWEIAPAEGYESLR